MNKFATTDGTRNFAERFPNAAIGHFRSAQGKTVRQSASARILAAGTRKPTKITKTQ